MTDRMPWSPRTLDDDWDPQVEQRFLALEAAGQNTRDLLGFTTWDELKRRVKNLQELLNEELSVEVTLNDRVQDAGHFATMGHLVDHGDFRAYTWMVKLSLYGKLAVITADEEQLQPDQVEDLETVQTYVKATGFELVPLRDLQVTYTGSSFKPEWVAKYEPDWFYFFFEYW